MNKDKHKLLMFRILTDAFSDKELSNLIAFKGGTSLMFFHGLPRFSTDLDFNILDVSKKEFVYQKMKDIAAKYGTIKDEQLKHFGPIVVLNYEKGESAIKLELSTRWYDNHYEVKSLVGLNLKVMVEPDMFAHKLCALLDRKKGMTGRDVFDIHFFLNRMTSINHGIVEQRMEKPLEKYIDDCIDALKRADVKELMANVGELLDGEYKQKMRSGKLVEETIRQLEAFKLIPQIQQYPQNEMPIEKVSIITNKQGEQVLSAMIGGKCYADKTITAHEIAQIHALPEELDRKNFLSGLVKENYYGLWKKNEIPRTTSLKL